MHGAPSCLLAVFVPTLSHNFPFAEIVTGCTTVSPKDAPRHDPICNPVISDSEKNVGKKVSFSYFNRVSKIQFSHLFLMHCPFCFACKCNFHTISLHGILVHNSNIIHDSTHGTLCDIVCAIFIEKLGICTKIILIRQITQSPEHVLVQSQVSASHLKLSCLYC